MADERQPPELRLALAMRGGVSLAVWIGGACAEIDELRRACDPNTAGESDDGFWAKLVEACGYSRVVVDVLAGASAGGLNGVLFASAIRHGFRMVDLENIWREVADVGRLTRRNPPWTSVLDGDGLTQPAPKDHIGFLTALRGHLAELMPPSGDSTEPDHAVDLRLSATLVAPVSTPAPSPSDERLIRSRSAAGFHFRHDARGAAARRDLERDEDSLWRLALAGRATSSFPVAFEPALVRSSRPGSFSETAVPGGGGPLVDCRRVFSDTAGPAVSDPDVALHDVFTVADGGIVDNIPLGRALEAVRAAPADGPTERVLVYLHPSGPPPPPLPRLRPVEDRPDRSPVAVLQGAWRAKVVGEGIDDDIAKLERANASIRLGRLLRRSTVKTLPSVDQDGVRRIVPTQPHWEAYVLQRSAADAARLGHLLGDPLGVLGEDPFPLCGAAPEVWRAPLAEWSREQREALETALATMFDQALRDSTPPGGLPGGILSVGLSPLRRSLDLSIEWCRYLNLLPASLGGGDPAVGAIKRRLYDLRSSLAVLERTRRLGWVTLAANARPSSVRLEVGEWAERAVRSFDSLLSVSAGAADALTRQDPDATGYTREAMAKLDALVGAGVCELEPAPAAVDARRPIIEALASLVRELIDVVPAEYRSDSPGGIPLGLFPDDHPGALADRVLRYGAGEVSDRLGTVEVLSLAEQLAGAVPTTPIDFYRISAAAPTPLAEQFTKLSQRSRAIGDAKPDGWSDRPDFLRPEVKLAGNELANFSAFLDERWRGNDWMWGRLDAVSGLVTLLVDGARSRSPDGTVDLPSSLLVLAGMAPDAMTVASTPEERDAVAAEVLRTLVGVRQEAVADACGVTAAQRRSYSVGIETLNRPGSKQIRYQVVSAVGTASKVLRAQLPRRWRFLAVPAGWVARAWAWRWARPRGGLPPPPDQPG